MSLGHTGEKMTRMGGEWGWQGDRGQAMAEGHAVAQPGGRGITSWSPSVCPVGPGEEKEQQRGAVWEGRWAEGD